MWFINWIKISGISVLVSFLMIVLAEALTYSTYGCGKFEYDKIKLRSILAKEYKRILPLVIRTWMKVVSVTCLIELAVMYIVNICGGTLNIVDKTTVSFVIICTSYLSVFKYSDSTQKYTDIKTDESKYNQYFGIKRKT